MSREPAVYRPQSLRWVTRNTHSLRSWQRSWWRIQSLERACVSVALVWSPLTIVLKEAPSSYEWSLLSAPPRVQRTTAEILNLVHGTLNWLITSHTLYNHGYQLVSTQYKHEAESIDTVELPCVNIITPEFSLLVVRCLDCSQVGRCGAWAAPWISGHLPKWPHPDSGQCRNKILPLTTFGTDI
jgi:hypothetical protein